MRGLLMVNEESSYRIQATIVQEREGLGDKRIALPGSPLMASQGTMCLDCSVPRIARLNQILTAQQLHPKEMQKHEAQMQSKATLFLLPPKHIWLP